MKDAKLTQCDQNPCHVGTSQSAVCIGQDSGLLLAGVGYLCQLEGSWSEGAGRSAAAPCTPSVLVCTAAQSPPLLRHSEKKRKKSYNTVQGNPLGFEDMILIKMSRS